MMIPVLLTGGSGSRLWPLSRQQHPKQFLRLTDDHSLLENTVLRLQGVADLGPVLAVGAEAHRFVVAEHLRRVGQDRANIILEPCGRNTAPAAAVAALQVAKLYGPETLMMLCPADHAVVDVPAFQAAVERAQQAAQRGGMVTFGIKPTHAETGYGYIKVGQQQEGAYALEAFVEKPDAPTAQAYVDSGQYYWNGGMFIFRAQALLDELQQHAPEILQACEAAFDAAEVDGQFLRLNAQAFEQCPSDSIDYAVMEKTQNASVVPLDCGWNDVGAWTYLQALGQPDEQGNIEQGDVYLEQVSNTAVKAQHRLVAAVGVDDLIIVESQDAVLVAKNDQVQSVKKIVSLLQKEGRSEADVHPKVYRPWGSYESVEHGPRHQVKRIIVNPGQKLSLQMHHHRAEHWIVVNGTAKVTCGEKTFLMSEDESTYIPVGEKHRLENPGAIPLELIEVQTGSYLGEDDIVRFDDDYGRTPSDN